MAAPVHAQLALTLDPCPSSPLPGPSRFAPELQPPLHSAEGFLRCAAASTSPPVLLLFVQWSDRWLHIQVTVSQPPLKSACGSGRRVIGRLLATVAATSEGNPAGARFLVTGNKEIGCFESSSVPRRLPACIFSFGRSVGLCPRFF